MIFTNKHLKYAEVKWQTFTVAYSDFQTVTLSISDSKYVVSFMKACASLPEMKLHMNNKKPNWLKTAKRKDTLLDQAHWILAGGRWTQKQLSWSER